MSQATRSRPPMPRRGRARLELVVRQPSPLRGLVERVRGRADAEAKLAKLELDASRRALAAGERGEAVHRAGSAAVHQADAVARRDVARTLELALDELEGLYRGDEPIPF